MKIPNEAFWEFFVDVVMGEDRDGIYTRYGTLSVFCRFIYYAKANSAILCYIISPQDPLVENRADILKWRI